MISCSVDSLRRLCNKLRRQCGRDLVVVYDNFTHSYRVHDKGSYYRLIGNFKTISQVREFLLEQFIPISELSGY